MVMDATIAGVPGGRARRFPRPDVSLRRLIAFPLISLVALGMGIGFAEWTIDKAVKADGLSAALVWSRGFSPEIEGRADDVINRRIDPLRALVAQGSWRREGVTSLRLFDGRGRGLLSDEDSIVEVMSSDHNLDAVRVIGSGQSYIRLLPPANLAVLRLAEVFVPLRLASGEVVAVAAVTLDETAEIAKVRAEVYGLALKFASLAAGAAALVLGGLALRRQASPAPTLPAEPRVAGPVDDWLVAAIETAVRRCPKPVEIECRLGLGALALPGDASAQQKAVTQFLQAVFDAGLETRRVIVSSDLTARGVEISLVAGGSPPAGLAQLFQKLGGGLDTRPDADGPGMSVTAWWPAPTSMMEAS